MKKALTNNIALKLIAFAAAVILWLLVMNIEDPVNVRTYSNVQVIVKNDNIITDEDKTYQVADNSYTINVSVEAKRSVLRKITASDIEATADFNNISLDKLVPIEVHIPSYENECESIVANPNNLQIIIEDEETIKLPITVTEQGTPKLGHFVAETETDPSSVSITGGHSVLSKIDKAEVTVNVEGFSEDTEVYGPLKLYDSDGKEIDTTGLKFDIDIDRIKCNVSVSENKTVHINAKYTGEVGDGYIVDSIVCEPETIEVTGSMETLARLTSIDIPESAIDITGANSSVEITIDITQYLPQGIQLADDSSGKILVTVNIKKESEKNGK